ncbi:recombinase family protein [Tsukamurella strandjordii]|uniref:Recombinase family protein n=1 Tax=Tsukamurella strandjordii TaxID=147577 RepID=A0AA90NT42_9ACTN|nr:recombinase family protein [Tsukamurella strandjordii]MDP0400384.1 recombinase family protein [Tsukamurella strandjordii]
MIGYLRVSTDEQARSGLGLEAQEAALRAEADRRGWELTILRDEGLSGKQVNPALREALGQLAAGLADGLVVAKMDRISRSLLHAVEILDTAKVQGWALVVLDLGVDLTTPAGRALAGTMAVFAEFERELIRERTRAAAAAAKARGVKLGRPSMVPQGVARRIVAARESGQSYGKIAAALTADGILSPAGRTTWQASTVRRICNSIEQAKEAA